MTRRQQQHLDTARRKIARRRLRERRAEQETKKMPERRVVHAGSDRMHNLKASEVCGDIYLSCSQTACGLPTTHMRRVHGEEADEWPAPRCKRCFPDATD